MKDRFSSQSSLYARYRPGYPPALFDYILSFVAERSAAWDCATGNGQTATVLAKYFSTVIATDISSNQLANAVRLPNIFYSVQPATTTNIANESIDLITVSQAIHWFEFDAFYREVNRVAKYDAVLAVWGYSLLKINEAADKILEEYHFKTLAGYWDAERKYLDDGYRNIPFPFKKIATPQFAIEQSWSLEDLEGYLNTWSALQRYMAVQHLNPVPELVSKIRPHWGPDPVQKIKFPIHLLLGTIE